MLIKKYGNRRLYDTDASRYITLEELTEKIRVGAEVRVVDAKSGRDLTQPTLTQIAERYGDSVRHVFKQLPLPMHPQARLGAEASLCANAQGKFWEMHDWLFANKDKIARDTLVTEATALGMNAEAFAACLDGNTFGAQVDEDMSEARSFGITGTPGFLINGIAIRGAMPFEEFTRTIDSELKRQGLPVPVPAAGTATDG